MKITACLISSYVCRELIQLCFLQKLSELLKRRSLQTNRIKLNTLRLMHEHIIYNELTE